MRDFLEVLDFTNCVDSQAFPLLSWVDLEFLNGDNLRWVGSQMALVDDGVRSLTQLLAYTRQSFPGSIDRDGPLTYLLLISSFICSAMSKSAGGLEVCRSWFVGLALDIDFLTAKDLAFEGEEMFILEGDRGVSGDTVAEPGAMAKESQAVNPSRRGGVLSIVLKGLEMTFQAHHRNLTLLPGNHLTCVRLVTHVRALFLHHGGIMKR
jgi:hypothetical protein